MIAERLSRGFHRFGLVAAIPCGLGAIAALVIALGLFAFPQMVGPIFGLSDKDFEVTAPDGSSFRFKKVLEEERRGVLSPERQALLDEARGRGLVPTSSRSETSEGALVSIGVAGALILIGLLWYGVMRTVAWVIGGFFD